MPLHASPQDRYGWRARIGFITPTPAHENNAYEFYLMAPEGVTTVMTSLGVRGFVQAEYDSAVDRLEAAAAEIMGRRPDAIVQAGVPLIVTHGWGFEDEVLGRIARVTPTPAATDIGACIAAMASLGMKRVAMLTPFDDAMHEHLRTYVANAGIEVVASASVLSKVSGGELRAYEVSTMALRDVHEAAASVFRGAADADGVWITGALMPSVAVIDPLERELGVPVVTSMQAMAWRGLRLAGVDDAIEGYGRLFGSG